MERILELLITYWKPIVGLLFTIAGFIIAVCKKKPLNDILSDIYRLAILAVIDTEIYSSVEVHMSSEDKLRHALNYIDNGLKSKYPTLDVDRYTSIAKQIVEELLSTPHKKG